MSLKTQRRVPTDVNFPEFAFAEDENTGLRNPSDGRIQVVADGALMQDFPTVTTNRVTGLMSVKLVVPVQVALTGVFGSMANPFGYPVRIVQALWEITTASTGASTVDIGVAADAVTSNDGLLDGQSGATITVIAGGAGTNGRASMTWGTTEFVNIAEASGDVAGIICDLRLIVERV